MATDKQIEEWLMQGYGCRKAAVLCGELIFENHRIVRDTLHTKEVYVRDQAPPLSNPMNEPQCIECNDYGCSLCEEHEENDGQPYVHDIHGRDAQRADAFDATL